MVFGVLLYVGLLVGSFLSVFVGLQYVSDGFQRYREDHAVTDTPISRLDAVALGTVAVSGTVQPLGETVQVPVGDEDCVCYDLTVRDHTTTAWSTEVDERESVPFVVDDGHGRARVDPAAFTLDLTDDRQASFEVKSYDDPPARVAAFAEDRDLPDLGMSKDREFEYEYLAPGDEVYVFGRATIDETREDEVAKPIVVEGDVGDALLANKVRETLQDERRFSLVKSVAIGVVLSTVGLAAFLWLSGIAQLFLGA
ncbi:GIDE domain-containing protein [Haloarchaeobius amylolyticus]|uniref:GIDE domain-containing protein n=1 Tax=Haloarchaeobius amylolyticus TaxID=1198296 RepID=UPI00226E8B52|nr:GIDE domain-containing protein [Haloarchaeobius amylolyticus]